MKQLWLGLFAVIIGFLASATVAAQQVSYFRQDGGVTDQGKPLPQSFDASQQLWRQPLAPGHSTPCVYGDTIYVTTFDGEQLATIALDRSTGRIDELHAIG